MKYHAFIYGRTRNIDFRVICNSPNGIMPYTEALAKQLINTDVPSNGDINRLRYLFVEEPNQVLFGIGFNHRHFLPEELHTDFSNRRGLRSFVGIVVNKEEFDNLESIPISSEFYIDLYKKIVSPIWNFEDRPKNRKVIISGEYFSEPLDDWCRLDGNIKFNNKEGLCRFFIHSDEGRIIASLKECRSSVAIGLNTESHIITAARRFNVHIPNAVCMDTSYSHDDELLSISSDSQQGGMSHIIQEQTSIHTATSKDSHETYIREDKDVANTPAEPAIIKSLKEIRKTTNLVQKDTISTDDSTLMSIDWGEATTPERSAEIYPRRESEDCMEKVQQSSFEEYYSGDKLPIPPKKAFRPKLVMVIVLLVIVVIVLLCKTCQGNQTSQDPSISGDTIQTDSINLPKPHNM